MIDTDKYEGHTIDTMTASQASETSWFLEHPSSPNHSSEILVNKATADLIQDKPLLLAEVKRLQMYEQEHKELWDIIADFSPKDSEEDNDTYQEWLDSVSQGYMGSVYEYVMMKQEEMTE